jgi:SPP1 family predicted phage head-tail adaptor
MNRREDIGARRERIVIEELTETVNSSGEPVKSWATFTTLWARAEFESAAEFGEMAKVNTRAALRLITNYRADITETMRISWRDKYWNIHGFEPDAQKFDMAIIATRVA